MKPNIHIGEPVYPFISSYTPTVLERLSYNLTKPAINIACIGEVSCGKSTFLNSIFIQKYGNISKKRTTMSINIYEQEKNPKKVKSAVDINRIISDHEKQFVQNNDQQMAEVQEYQFPVSPVQHFADYNFNAYGLNFIDIPGFNDRTSNNCLLKWLTNSIVYFDCIFFIIDGDRALNTESEVKLLDAVLDYIVQYKNIKLFVLFNKFDDEYDHEMKEMYDQAVTIVNDHCRKRNIDSYKIIKISTEYAYIYRHLYYRKTLHGLDEKQQRKLGVEELGKRAKNMKIPELEAMVIKNLGTEYARYQEQMHGFRELNNAFKQCVVTPIRQCFAEKMRKLLSYLLINVKSPKTDKHHLLAYVQEMDRICIKSTVAECKPEIHNICVAFLESIQSQNLETFIASIGDNSLILEKHCHDRLAQLIQQKCQQIIQQQGIFEFNAIVAKIPKENYGRYFEYIRDVLRGLCSENEKQLQKTNSPKELVTFVDIMRQYKLYNWGENKLNQVIDKVMSMMVNKFIKKGSQNPINVQEICSSAHQLAKAPYHTKKCVWSLLESISESTNKNSLSLVQLNQIGEIMVLNQATNTSMMNEFVLSKIANLNDAERVDMYLLIQNLIANQRISAKTNYALFKLKYFSLPFGELASKPCTYNWGDFKNYPHLCQCIVQKCPPGDSKSA